MPTNMQNVSMYDHTMNGIITLCDGMGTIIENNSIITGNISSNNITKMLGNISLLETKTTNQSFSGSTTSFIGGLQVTGNITSPTITAIIENVTLLQTKTTNQSFSGSTTSFTGNVLIKGQIDASNVAITGYIASGESISIGGDLAVANNIVNSGSIITGKNIQCNLLTTQSLVVNNEVIQSDTQAQIDYIFEILARNQLT